jgi:hypothetical protein
MLFRLLVVIFFGLLVFGIVYLAAGSVEGVRQSIPFYQAECAPRPCASPQGFEADISNVQVASGAVTMDITLRNKTTKTILEAASYRHTSPADFQLNGTDGVDRSPISRLDCPDWGEVRVPRGGTAGPYKLCFDPPRQGLQGAVVLWNPDVGLFTHRVSIHL